MEAWAPVIVAFIVGYFLGKAVGIWQERADQATSRAAATTGTLIVAPPDEFLDKP